MCVRYRDVLIITSAISKWPISFVNRLIRIGKNQVVATNIAHAYCKIHTCTLEHVLIINKVRDNNECPSEAEGNCLGLFTVQEDTRFALCNTYKQSASCSIENNLL